MFLTRLTMFKGISLLYRRSVRRWLYPLISVTVAVSIFIGSAYPTLAISWEELILRGVQVIQLSTLSDRQEVALGRQINKQLLNKEVRLFPNPAAQEYINQMGQRLAQASDRPNIPYKFQVVDDNNINAFATMGGFVYVHTGLIAAADNEAQLASVIAHEIGHIAGRHAVKQMRQMAVASGVASVAGVDQSILTQIGVELALRRPNSREAEYEADQMGIATLGRAGYAQRAAIDFMGKLLEKGSPPTFLSTHPATSNRIAAMTQAINPNQGNSGAGLDDVAYRSLVQKLLS